MTSRRVIVSLYLVLFAVFGTGAALLLDDARREYLQLKAAEAALRTRLADKEAQLRAQEKILERLRSDPDYVEKVIRRRLGWAKPGEVIFRFED